MEIQLSEEVQAALEERASMNGMSVSDYASLLMREQLQEDTKSAAQREKTVEAFREYMKTSTSALGREGRNWREFTHEGHAD